MKSVTVFKNLFDHENNIELHIIKIGWVSFSLAKYHVLKDEWEYSSQSMQTLKDAMDCFDIVMQNAPINDQLKSVD